MPYLYANEIFYYKDNQKILLTPINSISRENSTRDYYKDENGRVVGITNRLIIKLDNPKELDTILNDFNLTLLKQLTPDMYLVKTPNKSQTLDISNQLTKKASIQYAYPDFIKKRMSR
jgi:hypothetical protein